MSKMEKMPMCRICLVENVRMNIVDDKELQKLYETLTDIPFVTEDRRPMLACFMCFTQLNQCCQLQRKCLEAEKLFAQMMNEPNPLVNRDDQKVFSEPAATPAENISRFECVTVKQELPDVCETQDETKVEHFEYELELEHLNNSYSDAEDIPAQQSKHGEPSIKIKTEVEEEPSKKRRASDTTRAVESKKQNLHVREKKLEDVIAEIQKKNVESTKVTQNTPSDSFTLIPKFQELLANTKPQINISLTLAPSGSNTSKKRKATKDIRIHTDEKSFKCDVCQISFIRKNHLTNHLRTHTREKPFECKQCQLSFSQKVHLTNHIRMHTGEKPYKCEECQLCFSRKDYLTRHMRAHTGEKPYICKECQRCFSQKVHLTRHMRTHTVEKPYKCEECQLVFTQKGHLTSHILRHTGEKPYKCEECQLCFEWKQQLTSHNRTHTGETPCKTEETC
ncbi:hypothetical protein PYW07_012955 [Mythimna separata]|uniref:Uncharacterized protein n=1 Tax=Mythimna separata TaxID=271217 RepID=A0AAD7Y9K9_MYTSE|nr:hypothetical protein PYW07_012955 [Mythimna separata]